MELLYFILGSAFIIIGTSFMQFIADTIESFSQLIMYKIAFKIWKYKKQMGISDQEEDDEEVQKIPMGFHSELIGTEIESTPQEQEEEEE